VETHGHGLVSDEPVTPAEQADEMLLMGLRLREGVDLARHAMLGGRALDERRIATLEEAGLIAREGPRLKVLPEGFPVLNAVLAHLAG